MMKWFTYGFLCCLGFVEVAEAQPITRWELTVGIHQRNIGHAITAMDDGSYVIAGNSSIVIDSLAGIGTGSIFLARVRGDGTVVWKRTLGGDDQASTSAYAIAPSSDGGFVLAGHRSHIDWIDSTFSDPVAYLAATDANGNLQWERSFVEGGFRAIVPVIGGGYALAGHVYDQGEYCAYLVRTDATGHPVWERVLDAEGFNAVKALMQTPDGGFALAGAQNVGEHDRPFVLMKTDEAGRPLWQRTYSSGQHQSHVLTALKQTPDGGYVLAGSTDDGLDSPRAYIVKTDAEGEVEWEQVIGKRGMYEFTYGHALELTEDGGYMLAGTMNRNMNPDIFLAKLDEAGTLLWIWQAGNQEYLEQGLALTRGPGGTYVVAGEKYYCCNKLDEQTQSSANSDVYVVQVQDDQDTGVGTSEIVPPPSNAVMEVYPNPIHRSTQISFTLATPTRVRLEVFSVLGERVATLLDGFRGPGQHVLRFEPGALPGGIYFLRLMTSGEVQSRRMVLVK